MAEEFCTTRDTRQREDRGIQEENGGFNGSNLTLKSAAARRSDTPPSPFLPAQTRPCKPLWPVPLPPARNSWWHREPWARPEGRGRRGRPARRARLVSARPRQRSFKRYSLSTTQGWAAAPTFLTGWPETSPASQQCCKGDGGQARSFSLPQRPRQRPAPATSSSERLGRCCLRLALAASLLCRARLPRKGCLQRAGV